MRIAVVALTLSLSASQIGAQEAAHINIPAIEQHHEGQDGHTDNGDGSAQDGPDHDSESQARPDPVTIAEAEQGGEQEWAADQEDSKQHPVSRLNQFLEWDWAKYSLIASPISAFVSFLTMCLIGATLIVTRGMLREAKAATAAANAAVDATREIGWDQTRAYLTIHDADIRFAGIALERAPNGRTDAYTISLSVRNTGATPAEWFMLEYEISMRQSGATNTDGIHLASGSTRRWVGPASGRDLSFPINGIEVSNAIHAVADSDMSGAYLSLRCKLIFGTIHKEVREWCVMLNASRGRIRSYRSDWKLIYSNADNKPQPVKLQFSALRDE